MIALLDNLKTHLPFSLLDDDTFKTIEESSQIAYYPEHTVLIEEETVPQNVYVIIKGIVKAKDGEDLTDVYQSNDLFAAIEVIRGKGSKDRYVVAQELICYEIPADLFLNISKKNQDFKTYFLSSIMERMELMKEKKNNMKSAEMMVARVDENILHSVCTVDADMPILDALSKLESSRSAAIIVENDFGYGIVTDADLRYYILHKEEDELSRISQIQSYPLLFTHEDELLFNVLLLMTEHNIKHLPVLDEDDKVLGVLELTDLLSSLSHQSHLISVQMEKAENIDEVVQAAKRVDIMVSLLHSRGVKSRYIAKMVSEIHKKMYAKLFEFVFPEKWHSRCTLILLGSEGRGEQILRTDQDNALIFEDGFDPEDKVSVTEKFIETLDAIGYPRCKGNVMAINPQWSRSVSEYKESIREWITSPDYEGLMNMAIVFDTYAVAGNIDLFKTLRTYLLEKVKEHKEFLPHFARSIESFESPLGLFSRFVSSDKAHKNEIDIKKGALFAIVHGVRALALEHGIHKTNTTQRIKALNDVGYMNKEDARDLLETLEVLNTLRLHAQLEKLEAKEEVNNYICLGTLGKLKRDTLKEALKTVESFKKRVSYHFHLSMVS